MKRHGLPIGFGVALVVGLAIGWNVAGSGGRPPTEAETIGRGGDAPFAVVELFTSEGCSSCPPADALLGDLVRAARKDGRRVFALSFHVDYWNRLGWTDPFSNAAYTRRQNAYAEALRAEQVYTPQTIVNGEAEFVGSDAARTRAAVAAALKQRSTAGVTLRLDKAESADALAVAYAVAPVPKGAVLHVAAVERGLSSAVKRGENSGRTLRHENVVRAFTTVRPGADGKGAVQLKLPAGLVRKNVAAIAYVQQGEVGPIVGANGLDLEPRPDR